MNLLQTIAIALSMFSALPMPQFAWNEKNMRYTMAAFPLVGVLVAGCVWLWALLCATLDFGPVLTGAGLCLVPLVLTGGIHLDGFCDTTDALASHAPRERKLEILKDSHAGAFAVIGVAAYLLFYAALGAEIALHGRTLFALGVGFVLSRAASGLAVASFPCAKNSGLVHTFSDLSAKRQVRGVLLLLIALCAFLLLNASLLIGACVLGVTAIWFLLYYCVSRRVFGGITGDLAGWFLQWCELLILAALLLAQKLG